MFRFNFFWKPKFLFININPKRLLRPLALFTGTMLAFSYSKLYEEPLLVDEQKYIEPKYKMRSPYIKTPFREKIAKFFRILQLFIIFFPTLLLLPFRFFKMTENIWYNTFVRAIQSAGVVWIKAFQYLSHRRDVIGQKMAEKFIHLRQKSPAHHFSQTQATFQKQFGQNVEQIFETFNKQPIGVGSIGQVYQATYKGQKVAVKVRHPKVEINIERDIDIIFLFSKILSKISKFFQAPITNYSLKQTLINQIDFNVEAQNLMKFINQYKNEPDIHFPTPIISRQTILVQDFVQGVPITNCQQTQNPFNKQLARAGANVFFQMLMIHNFIHADLHGGNIMVRLKQFNPNLWQRIVDRAYIIKRWFQTKYVELFQKNIIVKALYLENKAEEDEVRAVQKKQQKKVDITLIDVGMVLKMGPIQQQKFITFIQSIIEKQPKICADMIYNLSIYQGRMINTIPQTKSFESYYNNLLELFTKLTQIKLKDLQGLALLKGMLDIIREYGMSLQGEFATLLTNILILQQVGKNLNPDINILKCAVPYFKSIVRG